MPQQIVVLDSSSIATFLVCTEKWRLANHEHLRLAGDTPKGLMNGTVFHKLLELYYGERLHQDPWAAAQEATIKFATTPEASLDVDLPFLLKRFADYVTNYATTDWIPIKLDKVPSTEVGFTHVFYEDADFKFLLEGKIDLISAISKELIFIDHKTQGRYAGIYPYSVQFLNYSLVTGFRKAVINVIGLQKTIIQGTTFRRQLIEFPPHMMDTWRMKLMSIFQRVASGLRAMEVNPHVNPFQNFPNPACAGNYGYPCQFTQLCELHPDNKTMYENLKQFKYSVQPWEPWKIEDTE